MTLDEAIKHCEEVAEKQEKIAIYTPFEMLNSDVDIEKCQECANEHRQLAEWLKELKQLREQTRWIPVSESLPALDEDGYSIYVLVSFGLLTQTGIGQCREIDGQVHWYLGDDAKAIENYGVHVNAWMPLPEPYIESEGEE